MGSLGGTGDGANSLEGLEGLMKGIDMESLMGSDGLESLNSLMGGAGFEDLMKGVMSGLNGDAPSNLMKAPTEEEMEKLQKDMDLFLQTKH